MTTLITRTGQQYSSATPHKLKAFRYLMGYHAGVCELIMKKYSQPYIYIDLNCGAGDQPEYCEFGDEVLGSPIIAIQELNKKGIHPICHFCDSNQEALDNLKVAIQSRSLRCEAHYWFGDNKNSLLSIAEELCDSQFNGLIYSDPNGKQDFPLNEIKQVIHLPQMRKVDILMNAATTYLKRWEANPKVNWEPPSLNDITFDNGKERTFIRQPEYEDRSMKWTFIYATNWAKQKNLEKIRLYDINSEIGREISNHISNPRSTALPIDRDGTIGIQQKLDLSTDDSNTRNTEVDS